MSSSKTPIRTAIIGYGISGELSHAQRIAGIPEYKIVAVCDTSEKRRKKAMDELGCDTYSSHKDLLPLADQIDLVCVVTRSDTHCEIAIDCLRAGIDALITKPWVLDQSEADRLLAASAESRSRIFPWMPMYWSPEYLTAKDLIQSGRIGDPFIFRRYICQFWRRNDWQTQSSFGGGYLLNWGMHIVQPLLDLANSPVKRVSGFLQQYLNPGDADDNFQVIMEFENGARAIAEFTEAIDGLPTLMVQGTKGTILSNQKKIAVLEKDPDSNQEPVRHEYPIGENVYGDEVAIYRDLAQTILHGTPFSATIEAAYQGTLVLDAARKSHHTGQSISIPDFNLPEPAGKPASNA